jgi:hypothetical protein
VERESGLRFSGTEGRVVWQRGTTVSAAIFRKHLLDSNPPKSREQHYRHVPEDTDRCEKLYYSLFRLHFKHGKPPKIITHVTLKDGPPLWSSGQSFWLQIQRTRIRFPALPDFLRSKGLERGPLSLVRIIEELPERKVAAPVKKTEINGRGDSLR